MEASARLVVLADGRGGQNSADPPFSVDQPQVVAASNVEWYRATYARKRRGSRLVEASTAPPVFPSALTLSTLAGVQRPANPLTSFPLGIILEASNATWYQWGYDPDYEWHPAGAVDTATTHACVAYFNGKWYAAYKSSVDRLHYIGVGVGGSSGFRAGLAAPAAPAITESAGAATDNRKYRAVTCVLSGSTYLLRSEPGAETAVRTLTAEQASAAAPGAAPTGESYNAWELQVASDDDNYANWWIVGTAGPTTAIVDNNASVFGLTPAPELGLHEPPRSVKYLQVDDNRLLLAGLHEDLTDAALQWRVWFTPVLGDLNIGDDQRIPNTASGQKNWVDVDAGDQGGDITAFGPATLGDVLVFKRRQLWRLVRTGNLDRPYIPRVISKDVGTFGYRTVQSGEDQHGQPCVYFAGQRGPYRVGVRGVEYLGGPIEDVWESVNQYGGPLLAQHAVYYPDKSQYWLWVSVGTAVVPSVCLVFHAKTGGWSRITGPIATARCSALLPRFIQEPSLGVTIPPGGPHPAEKARWVPYCCPNTAGQLIECDAINPQTGAALDTDLETYSGSGSVWTDGTPYKAEIISAPIGKTIDGRVTVQEVSVLAEAASGVSLQVGLIPDYDTARQRNATVSLTPEGSGTRVVKRVDGAQFAAAKALQVSLGDASAVASQWAIDAAQVRVKDEATR